MNFLSIFVSTFLTSYFVCWIISLLGLRKKRQWMLAVVSLGNLSSIIYDVYALFTNLGASNFNGALYITGNLLAKLFAYIAIMMFLLDGVKLFKTRRQRAFLNSINDNKPGLPFYIAVIVFSILGGLSLAYAIIATMNYTDRLLWTLIGAYSIGVIFIGLALYLFITNKITRNPEKPLKASRGGLLFLLNNRHELTVYKSDSSDRANLGKLNDIYIFTEYGYLVTPKNKYTVIGINVDRISDAELASINMEIVSNDKLIDALKSYKKYETTTLWVDDEYNITKEATK